MRRPHFLAATVTITDTMPRLWLIRTGHALGVGIRLPDYWPMGGSRTHLGLTLLLRKRTR
jgi:hypothetical protein